MREVTCGAGQPTGPSTPTETGFEGSMTTFPGRRSATSAIASRMGSSQRVKATLSACCTASRLFSAALAGPPM